MANHVPHRPGGHLLPALLACALAGLIVGSGYFYARGLEGRYIHALAGDFSEVKLQGVALQQEAFAQDDLLVLYGSSELQKEMPNNATDFFATYRTGFRVFPVGRAGATSLSLLQRVASVGEAIRGCKVAISLSPGWFFTETFDPKYYEGNFSELQAEKLIFSNDLSYALKRDIAHRMLQFPRTLEGRDFLASSLRLLASDRWLDRTRFALLWPLGKLEAATAGGQDHLEAALHILEENDKLNKQIDQKEHPTPERMKWAEVLKRAARFANDAALQKMRNEVARKHYARGSRDRTFIETLGKAREWTDVELMMRVLKELGAEPLFLSMPVEDMRLEVYGISPEARTTYLNRIETLAYNYGFHLIDFHEYEKDPAFVVDFADHLSGDGWLYYNKALDDFFHGHLGPL